MRQAPGVQSKEIAARWLWRMLKGLEGYGRLEDTARRRVVKTVTLSTLARRLSVPIHVLRYWCNQFGVAIIDNKVDAAAELRLEEARDLIRVGKCSIAETKRQLNGKAK
jgi:hypothetical protein